MGVDVQVYSEYFGSWLDVLRVLPDGYFYFKVPGRGQARSRTPLQYYKDRDLFRP